MLITASCSSVHPELHNHALHFWLRINRITNRPKVGCLREQNHCSIVLIAPQSVCEATFISIHRLLVRKFQDGTKTTCSGLVSLTHFSKKANRASRRILFYTVKDFFMNNTRSISAINVQKHLLSNTHQHIGALEHGMTSESTLQNDFIDNRPTFLSDTSTHQTTDSIYFPFQWATLSSYR